MNNQATRPQDGTQRRTAPPGTRAPHRKRPNPALLRLLHGVMGVIGCMIFVVGLLLLILPLFRVKNIVVEGNSHYSPEEIIAASGIEIGDEMLAIDKNDVRYSIWQSCEYINEIGIGKSLFTVKIVVTEMQNVMYTEFEGSYYSLDGDFRVLEKCADEAAFADFLRVTLPPIASATVGKPLQLQKAETDLSYVTELISVLEKDGSLERVTSLDCSEKFRLSYVLDGSCRVEVGKIGDIEVKLELLQEILSIKGGTEAGSAVVDVSNVGKPTYRPVGPSELLRESET